MDPGLTRALVAIQALGVRLASEEYAAGARHVANAKPIAAVVAEARSAGARVVADSVESVEQEEALASLGVEIVQGYLYGPEVTPAELRTSIKRWGGSSA